MRQEKIKKTIKSLNLTISDEFDSRVHESITRAVNQTKSKISAAPQPNIWRIIMKNRITKIAVAAAIIVAATIGITLLPVSGSYPPGTVLVGTGIHRLSDGSKVKLTNGAKVQLYDNDEKRGFHHIAGQIEVHVAKGKGEFIIETPHGNARALGTVFTMDLIDDVPQNSNERLQMLALEVEEGTVELSNDKGSLLVNENQAAILEKDQAPYDFSQDKNLPPRVIERIQAMLDAFQAQDPAAWTSNFNLKAIYDLAHGNIADYTQHPWFSQMVASDVENLKNNLANVEMDQLRKMMIEDVNLKGTKSMYIRSIELSEDGKIVKAQCVKKTSGLLSTIPKWTYFDGDWWQTDD